MSAPRSASRSDGSAASTIPLEPAPWDSPYALHSDGGFGGAFDAGEPVSPTVETGFIDGSVRFVVKAVRTEMP